MADNNQTTEKTAGQGDQADTIVRRMEMIAQDMADDAKNFDGKPFNGRTVAEYFAYQGAAIATLADTIKLLVNDYIE